VGSPDDRLRIGLVSPYSLTIPGGVQQQVLGLGRALRAMGHEVRALGPCDGPPPETWVTPLGDSLPTAANGSSAPLAPDPSAALRTIRAINDEAFDVLHLHEPIAPGPTVTALLLRLAPMVGTFHAAGDVSWYRRLRRGAAWLATHLDVRVAVSPQARELAHRYLGGEYEVLFNGIDVDHYAPAAAGPVPGPAARERAVLFVGRHEPRKGLEVLLEAMAKVPDDVRLWVVSDGDGIGELRQRHAGDGRIEWLGRIPEEEKVRRMRACAAFCAPSLHGESFGVVLAEAMAAGAPVVASALDGYLNVATHERDALLVPPGDAASLAAAIVRIVADRELAARLTGAGRARAEALSMRHLAEEYVGIYRGVLERERLGGTGSPSAFVRFFEDRLLRRRPVG
jgi:phosphatidylinositol alpha-mannosyltransferase